MRIEHLALWCKDLEKMRDFYTKYFNTKSNEKYTNHKGFSSYFLSFEEGSRLEIMQMNSIPDSKDDIYKQFMGYIHFAISVGSEDNVDKLTSQINNDGYTVLDDPRRTGDGYYESVVLDPESNRLEITV